ncbi:MAG: hypothetical protein WCF04_00165 [Candidatus Nanopelagicales bacterium]
MNRDQIATRTGLDTNAAGWGLTAHLRPCHRCGQPVLTGLDDTTAALLAHVDPRPLDQTTYRVTTHAGRVTIRRRSHWHIAAGHPAGAHITADHQCQEDQ